jgi:hypothetical protein
VGKGKSAGLRRDATYVGLKVGTIARCLAAMRLARDADKLRTVPADEHRYVRTACLFDTDTVIYSHARPKLLDVRLMAH